MLLYFQHLSHSIREQRLLPAADNRRLSSGHPITASTIVAAAQKVYKIF
jgi:hypothetical protein